jgi:peptide/nickel transport system substrate-binding protein
VKWSWLRAANDPAKQFTFTLTALARDSQGMAQGIEAPDELTVQVKLAEQWTPFLSDVAMFNMAVISEAWASGNEGRLIDEPMGTGPFALADWQKGQAITLTRNEHYWGEDLPFLDEIIVSVVPDDNARVIQLQSGELDAIGDVPSSRLTELQGDPNLKVMAFPSSYIQYITLNNREAPLDDVNARLALQYAADKQTLIDVVLFGKGEIATSFMPKGTIYWNDKLPGFPYDLDKAKELMAASKSPDGYAVELQTRAGSEDENTLAAALKDMWAKIGVDVTIAPTEASVVDQNYKDRTFQTMVIAWTNDIIDPDEITYSLVLPENSEAFASGWSNAEAVELGRKGPHVPDGPERQKMYYRIQEIFNEDSPLVILFYKPYLVAAASRVRNFQQPPTGQWVWRRTWLDG